MRTLLLALLTLSSTTLALAGTDLQQFDRAVAKYGISLGGEPKGLCLCQDGTALERGTGYLLRATNDPGLQAGTVMIALGCFVPVFDETTGELRSQFICSKFVPLAK